MLEKLKKALQEKGFLWKICKVYKQFKVAQ